MGLDPAAVGLPGARSRVVIVRRSDATGGRWTPAATTLAPHGDERYLCTDGVTALGEFGIAVTTQLVESGKLMASRCVVTSSWGAPATRASPSAG